MKREAAALALGVAAALLVFYPLHLVSLGGEAIAPHAEVQAAIAEAKRGAEERGRGGGPLLVDGGAGVLIVGAASLAVAGMVYVAARRRAVEAG